MSFRIVSGKKIGDVPVPEGFETVYTGGTTRVDADEPALQVSGDDGHMAILFGKIDGVRSTGGELGPVTSPKPLLQEHLTSGGVRWSDRFEGRFALLSIDSDEKVAVRADRFGKRDIYLSADADGAIAASDLSMIPNPARDGFDQSALAHTLTYYGNRPPKRHTIYKSVSRLGIADTATLQEGSLTTRSSAFQPSPTVPYGEREHHLYVDAFLDHLRATGSAHGNVVLLSSGWDSTSILAGLVHVFGRGKVRAVIGRMLYSERSGNCNIIEIERAQAIARYFGVPLEIVDFDHGARGDYWLEKTQEIFRDNHYFSLTGVNHFILCDYVQRTTPGGEVVFAGEISDGAHNLGFSQYVTMFHPSYEFREYADKMASYLYGPTFVRQFLDNEHQGDVIFNLFRSRSEGVSFDDPAESRAERMRQVFISFFLRNGRQPLWSLANNELLTESGRDQYTSDIAGAYFGGVDDASPEELYSWYLHLYNSFHWQGSTVATLFTMADEFQLSLDLPFWDGRLQDFLSTMPEQWGRGLDLNSTKYPLKWMLANRLDYPMHLQTGPHSYTYDVDPSFSHVNEIFYHSAIAPIMQSRLREGAYRDILSTETFDIDYADALVAGYVKSEPVTGSRLSDLVSLALLSQTGWHG